MTLTLHGAEIRLHHFSQKLLIGQKIVKIETSLRSATFI